MVQWVKNEFEVNFIPRFLFTLIGCTVAQFLFYIESHKESMNISFWPPVSRSVDQKITLKKNKMVSAVNPILMNVKVSFDFAWTQLRFIYFAV